MSEGSRKPPEMVPAPVSNPNWNTNETKRHPLGVSRQLGEQVTRRILDTLGTGPATSDTTEKTDIDPSALAILRIRGAKDDSLLAMLEGIGEEGVRELWEKDPEDRERIARLAPGKVPAEKTARLINPEAATPKVAALDPNEPNPFESFDEPLVLGQRKPSAVTRGEPVPLTRAGHQDPFSAPLAHPEELELDLDRSPKPRGRMLPPVKKAPESRWQKFKRWISGK